MNDNVLICNESDILESILSFSSLITISSYISLVESQGRRLKVAEESGEDNLPTDKEAAAAAADTASSSAETSHAKKRSMEFRRLQRLLCEHLAAFLGQQTSGLHTLRKLSAADSKNLFVIAFNHEEGSSTPKPYVPASAPECKSPSVLFPIFCDGSPIIT